MSQPGAKPGSQCKSSRADFDKSARCAVASASRDERGRSRALGSVDKCEVTADIEAHPALGPSASSAHELSDRQRIEELVGDDEGRA